MTLLTLMIWKYLNLKKPIPFCSTSDLCCDYEHFQNWITLDPNHHNVPDVDIRSPLTRDIISKQTETWKKIFTK